MNQPLTDASGSPEWSALWQGLRLGSATSAGGYSFVPLLAALPGGAPDAGIDDALLLEEALARGDTDVEEISAEGSVNHVRIRHRGGGLLLLLDGEQILGAKQNRVFNASFVVRPDSEVVVPVSCVERGRWSYAGAPSAWGRSMSLGSFRAASTTLSGRARRNKLKRVNRSVMSGEGYDARQGEVWRDVDHYLEQSGVVSVTAAYQDGFETRRAESEHRLREIEPLPDQIGVAVVAGGKLLSMDLFGSPSLYRRAYRKVLSGTLVDVAEPEASEGAADHSVAVDVVERAVDRLRRSSPVQRAAPGGGQTLHGEADGLVFGGVVHEGATYHAMVAAA